MARIAASRWSLQNEYKHEYEYILDVAYFKASPDLEIEMIIPIPSNVTSGEVYVKGNTIIQQGLRLLGICLSADKSPIFVQQLDENFNVVSQNEDVSPCSHQCSLEAQKCWMVDGQPVKFNIVSGAKFLRVVISAPITIKVVSVADDTPNVVTGLFNNIDLVIIKLGSYTYKITFDVFLFGVVANPTSIDFGVGETSKTVTIEFSRDLVDMYQYPFLWHCENCSNVKLGINYQDAEGNTLCTDEYDPEKDGSKYLTKCTASQVAAVRKIVVTVTRKDVNKPVIGVFYVQYLISQT